MGNISHTLKLTLFLVIATFFTSNVLSTSLPYTAAPAPSPTTTGHHHTGGHHPGKGHHHHRAHAPAYSPTTTSPPTKPVIPVVPPVIANPPTTYPKPSVPPVKPPTTKPPTQPPVKPPTYPPVKPPTTKPPTQPPVKPPTYPPVKPPTYPPVKPPTGAPPPYSGMKKFVAVQGMVYCKKNCTYAGKDTLMGAYPLPGAKVAMRCKNTKYLIRTTGTTDKNGYFFIQAPRQVTSIGAHKCKVYMAHKQRLRGPCTHPAKLHNGDIGAFLNRTTPANALPQFSLFTVGPFALEPDCYKH